MTPPKHVATRSGRVSKQPKRLEPTEMYATTIIPTTNTIQIITQVTKKIYVKRRLIQRMTVRTVKPMRMVI